MRPRKEKITGDSAFLQPHSRTTSDIFAVSSGMASKSRSGVIFVCYWSKSEELESRQIDLPSRLIHIVHPTGQAPILCTHEVISSKVHSSDQFGTRCISEINLARLIRLISGFDLASKANVVTCRECRVFKFSFRGLWDCSPVVRATSPQQKAYEHRSSRPTSAPTLPLGLLIATARHEPAPGQGESWIQDRTQQEHS